MRCLIVLAAVLAALFADRATACPPIAGGSYSYGYSAPAPVQLEAPAPACSAPPTMFAAPAPVYGSAGFAAPAPVYGGYAAGLGSAGYGSGLNLGVYGGGRFGVPIRHRGFGLAPVSGVGVLPRREFVGGFRGGFFAPVGGFGGVNLFFGGRHRHF